MDEVQHPAGADDLPAKKKPTESLLSAARFPFITVSVLLLAGICGLAVYLTSSPYSSRDVQYHRQLAEILQEIRAIRAAKSSDFNQVRQRASVVGQQISSILKQEASTSTPAKQSMLWAARDELPRMLAGDLTKETPAEKSFEARLEDAATDLGLKR
ncbi:MAG: hypothetical protein JSS49_11290 [Planctomycetes bacterium]|nr:hypothetical protein [Planctomycetota bacterium]